MVASSASTRATWLTLDHLFSQMLAQDVDLRPREPFLHHNHVASDLEGRHRLPDPAARGW
jgi:hypothetical protein